jgi:hypothetical protein
LIASSDSLVRHIVAELPIYLHYFLGETRRFSLAYASLAIISTVGIAWGLILTGQEYMPLRAKSLSYNRCVFMPMSSPQLIHRKSDFAVQNEGRLN